MKRTLFLFAAIVLCGFLFSVGESGSRAQITGAADTRGSSSTATFARLIDSARSSGTVRVIVALHAPFVPEGQMQSLQVTRQRRAIKEAQSALIGRLSSSQIRNVKQFDYIPYMALETDEAGLRRLESDEVVAGIEEDVIGDAALVESTAIVAAPAAWASGYTGAGQTVAIVDSGVDKNHSFLAGRVVSEACYSSNVTGQSASVCPSGVTESTVVNSGLHCPVAVEGCAHGTNVAGIAAGRGTSMSGVAKDANIIAIQVFSRFDGASCGATSPCARYWTSDLIKGLERVRTLKATIPNIAAVNLSLQTGQQFASNCDGAHAATKAAIDNLRALGVATVICSGNFAFTTALTAPACISSSISVGSVDDGSLGTMANVVSTFSDSSPLLHLLAPGRWINSSIPDNSFANYSGTSMAAPHVTGAFAVLRQNSPNASVGKILKAMIVGGQPITDTRNGLVKPRLNIANALAAIKGTTPMDFDDDGKTDIGIYRVSSGNSEWWVNQSSTGATFAMQFGASSDRIAPADYTGDGKVDVAIFRPSSGQWFILRSEDNSFFAFPFGASGDIPVPADYDADGKADTALFRPSTATWFISQSGGGATRILQFGANGDQPVVGDYDGDGKADVGIFRPAAGEWWIQRSTAGSMAMQFGSSAHKPVQGDYTGDGKTDIAIWHPTTGQWLIVRSEDFSFYGFPFGASGDIPATGDYDGDGKFDPTLFRRSAATWFIAGSTAGSLIIQFGANGDRPIPSAFVP